MSKSGFQLDRTEQARMAQALKQSQTIERKSSVNTLKRFVIKIAESGRAATKVGKKNREIRQNPAWKKRSGITRYLIVRKLQPTGEVLLPKKTTKLGNDSRVKIKNKGLAKASWTWGLRLLGSKSGKTVRGGRKFTTVTKNLASAKLSIVLKIALTYISKIHPGIERTAIVNATNTVLKQQELALQKKLQRQFEK